jgi:hypothetical protein
MRQRCGRNESVEDFRQKLHAKIVPELEYRMGERYSRIVGKCLKDEFGAANANDGAESDVKTAEMKTTTGWLEVFLNEVVNELEGCSA